MLLLAKSADTLKKGRMMLGSQLRMDARTTTTWDIVLIGMQRKSTCSSTVRQPQVTQHYLHQANEKCLVLKSRYPKAFGTSVKPYYRKVIGARTHAVRHASCFRWSAHDPGGWCTAAPAPNTSRLGTCVTLVDPNTEVRKGRRDPVSFTHSRSYTRQSPRSMSNNGW